MSDRQREEVCNVYLAELLCGLGLKAAPETIQPGGKLPDVLIQYRGMRIIIEGKYADVSGAEKVVLNDAQKRIDLGIAHISLAVIYPSSLRTAEFKKLKKELTSSNYHFCVLSEVGQGPWHDGGIDDIINEIRRVQENLSKEDIVQKAADNLAGCLDSVARLFLHNPSVCDELSSILGVGRPGSEKRTEKSKRQWTTAKVAALTLANAFIFQEQLAGSNIKGIKSLRENLRCSDFVFQSIKHWDWICENINYVPIFGISSLILSKIPAGSASDDAAKFLAHQSLEVCKNKAALRHDLMGRIYHYLLHEAKFLGTYYTSVPAATLLLKLALEPELWPDLSFSKIDDLKRFKIIDLTCGTGTLLMAASQAVADNFIMAYAGGRRKLDEKRLGELHNALMEYIIHGYDVLPSAIHLTASTLALLSPEVVFDKLHLYVMPLNMRGKTALLGSLEFIDEGKTVTQFNLFEPETIDTETHTITGKGLKSCKASLPPTDLFVMNPPFVRSVGGNLLFGSLPDDKRAKMQAALKKRVAEKGLHASITSGLGGVFAAVADEYMKPGGRLAFVLPAATATGVAWEETRKLIQKNYHLEYVVISHQADRWSFSENTDLSELLFIARRLKKGEQNEGLSTRFINLWRNPSNIGDALAVARLIQKTPSVDVTETESPSRVANLTEAGRKYGELLSIPMKELKESWWGGLLRRQNCFGRPGFSVKESWSCRGKRKIIQFQLRR